MIVGNMATFPARIEVIERSIRSILPQLDRLNVCLNEFDKIPDWMKGVPKLAPVIPERDMKDVGKFIFEVDPADEVFLLDDDIIYPAEYTAVLRKALADCQPYASAVGLHGMIYADLFDGTQSRRRVFAFHHALDRLRVVNQLGTGTVLVKGEHLPSLTYMDGSQRFVDVRFARYAHSIGRSLVCVPREKGWLDDINPGGGIFETFTKKWPIEVTREVQAFAGYAKLNVQAVGAIERPPL